MLHTCVLLSWISILTFGGCGSVKGGEDNVAPMVTNVSPTSPSTVTEDFSVVITFSEPMNKASVESAIVLLPSSATPAFSWNGHQDELTITPGVRYPEGTDPGAVSLQQLAIALGTGGVDVAGNALASATTLDYTLQFKRITAVFPFSQTLSGNCSATCTGTFTFFQAGENGTDTVTNRGFLTIPFILPDGIIIDRAVLNSQIEALGADPFGKLGDLMIDHLRFTAINNATFAAPGTELGALVARTPIPAVGTPAAFEITDAVSEDYVNRVAVMNRTQYRIRFPHDTTDDPNYTTYHSDGISDVVRMLRTVTNVTVTYRIE